MKLSVLVLALLLGGCTALNALDTAHWAANYLPDGHHRADGTFCPDTQPAQPC